jgi:hypothetical protein
MHRYLADSRGYRGESALAASRVALPPAAPQIVPQPSAGSLARHPAAIF